MCLIFVARMNEENILMPKISQSTVIHDRGIEAHPMGKLTALPLSVI